MKSLSIFLSIIMFTGTAFSQNKPLENQPKNPICIIKTSLGDIHVKLFADETPKTVDNFIGLAEGHKQFFDPNTQKDVKRPYYDGLIFHRVIKNFMIQGGCPLGTGAGSPGFKFENEISAKALGLDTIKVLDKKTGQFHEWLNVRSEAAFQKTIMFPLLNSMGIKTDEEAEARWDDFEKRLYTLTIKDAYQNIGYRYDDNLNSHHPKRGVIAMANAGPNSNGSQFFINLIDTPWLTGKHTVFGEVIKGMDVVDNIGGVKVNSASKPVEEVKIISIRQYRTKEN